MNQFDEKRFSEDAVLQFNDGDLIFNEGEDSREMFVVRRGQVEIVKNTESGEMLLCTLHQGDFFGEMSLLESLPRSAAARAVGPVEVLAIQPGGFLIKIRRDPTFAFEMLKTLSHRLRITSEKLSREMHHATMNLETVQMILQQAEFSKQNAESTPLGTDFKTKKISNL